MTATAPSPLSGAISPEWRDITHHSTDSAPLNGNGRGTRRTPPRGRRGVTWAWNVLAVLLSAMFGFPIYWMLITAFKTSADINQLVPQFWPAHPTLRAFREV